MPMPRPRITGAVSAGQDVAGTEVEDPAGARLVQVVRSRRPSRPGRRGWPRRSRGPGRRRGRRSAAQLPTMSMPSASRGVWKPTSTWTGSNTGLNTAPPRKLVLALGLFLLGDLLQYSSKRDSCSGVPVMTTERLPLRMDSTGGSTVRTSWRTRRAARRCARGRRWSPTPSADLSPSTDDAAAAGHQRARGADQLRQRQQFDVLGALGLERLDAPGRPASARPWRPAALRSDPGPGGVSARMAAIWVSRMPGTEIAADVSCLALGSGSSAASARTHCIGSKPIGRTTTSSRATGSSSSSASPTSVAQLGLDAGRGDQLLEGLQPGAALAAEGDGVGLAGVQPIDEGVAGLSADSAALVIAARWTLCRVRLIVTSCNLLGPASRTYRVVLVVSGLSSRDGGPRSPAEVTCDSASNPDWLRSVRRPARCRRPP